MVKIRNNELENIIDWHYDGFVQHFLPKLSKNFKRKKKNRDLFKFLEANLELLITGKPEQLEEIIQKIDSEFAPQFYTIKTYKDSKRDTKTPTTLFNFLNKNFNYKKFTENRNDDWNAYRLAEKLKISACPYCNLQFTHTVIDDTQSKEEKRRIVRPDFDHFYDKATYPYLALSFYNLIPSCQICNSRMKGSVKFNTTNYLHPYLEEFGDLVKFSLQIKDSSFFHGNINAAELIFSFNYDSPENIKLNNKAKNNIEAFKLKEVYQEHLEYVFELVNKAFVFNKPYLDDLYKRFEGQKLFRNRDSLIRLISGNYVTLEDLQQRPLSKLTRDISEQFGLWE